VNSHRFAGFLEQSGNETRSLYGTGGGHGVGAQ
jgi:hypothetical protein